MPLRIRRGTNSERLTITPLEGELVYTTDTKLLYIGDGAAVGGNPAVGGFSGALTSNLNLSGFNITGTGNITHTGNTNTSGSTTTGSLIVSGNSTSGTTTTGSLVVLGSGVVQGTLDAAAFQGAVYNRDSTVVVDDAGHVHIDQLVAKRLGKSVLVVSDIANSDTQIIVSSDNNTSKLQLRRSSATILSTGTAPTYSDSPLIGTIQFEGDDPNGIVGRSLIQSSKGFFRIFHANASNVFSEGNQLRMTIDGNFGVGTSSPTFKLDVAGSARIRSNLVVSGSIDGSMTGSVFADNSSLIVDAISNKITTNSVDTDVYVKTGVYADDSARDTAISAPYAGMIVFNQTGNKFQGYTGSGWIDLN